MIGRKIGLHSRTNALSPAHHANATYIAWAVVIAVQLSPSLLSEDLNQAAPICLAMQHSESLDHGISDKYGLRACKCEGENSASMKVNVWAGEQLTVASQAMQLIMHIGRCKQQSRSGFAIKMLLGFRLAF